MIFLACLWLELLAGMEVDLFVPSFPLIQSCFCLSPFKVELTLAVNLLSYCLSSFWASPLADRFGKKKTILLGCLIFLLGSVFCSLASAYEYVLLGRFLQGIGIAFPCVLAYVVIADHYSEEQQSRFLGYMNGAVTLGMAAAPVIGCLVANQCDWRGNFYALTVLGGVALFMVIFFLPNDKAKRSMASMFDFRSLFKVFRCKTSMMMTVGIVIIMQAYWVFIALSPILYIKEYKIPLLEFGYYQGALAFVYAILSIFGGRIIGFIGNDLSMIYSMRLMVISGIMILSCLVFSLSPFWITVSLCIHTICIALPIIILWPKFINLDSVSKTERSSIATAARLIATAISVQTVSYFYDDSFFYIALFSAFVSFISPSICLYAYRLSLAHKGG